jgi:hypothetical protein
MGCSRPKLGNEYRSRVVFVLANARKTSIALFARFGGWVAHVGDRSDYSLVDPKFYPNGADQCARLIEAMLRRRRGIIPLEMPVQRALGVLGSRDNRLGRKPSGLVLELGQGLLNV